MTIRALAPAGLVAGLLSQPGPLCGQMASDTVISSLRPAAERLIAAATGDSAAHDRLALLVDTFGPRLSGSASLEAAIDWILREMKSDGLAHVRGQRVMVPHWERRSESLTMIRPRRASLPM